MGIMDVATFAKQLKEDGIEAAKVEADKILSDARKEAEKIVAVAKSEIVKTEKEANKRIQQEKTRSEDEMKLVTRDLVNSFKKTIEAVGTRLLQGKVAEALNSEEVVKTAITELIKAQSGKDWEISLSNKIAAPLTNTIVALFKADGASVRLGEALGKAGFELKVAGGNEVIELTDESVTESFKKLLSPELKKYLEA